MKRAQTSLSIEDITRALEASEGQVRVLVELLYACGGRVSEIVALRWQDIDFEEHTVRLQGKGGDERCVPMGRPCVEALLRLSESTRGTVAPTDPVFPGLTTQNVRDRLKVLGRRIGVRLTPHLFRHAFATHQLDRGASVRAVQEMMGHRKCGTTFLYWDLTPKHINQLVREIYMYLPRARAYLMAHPDCFSDLYDYRESP